MSCIEAAAYQRREINENQTGVMAAGEMNNEKRRASRRK
jgi:hypothetical protein